MTPSYIIAMKYRLPFFMTEITLLVLVGISSFRMLKGSLELYAKLGDLFCPATNSGPSVFLLLILMNLILIGLYFYPKNDVLWWLNLVGLISLAGGVLTEFSLSHVLIILCIMFGLGFRRLLGLKHIWHWRGMLIVGLALVAAFVIVAFGLSDGDLNMFF
jgi:hypothetical protein